MFAKTMKPLLAAAMCTTVLAGCAKPTDSVTVGAISDDYRKRHPIVVTQKEQTLDIAVASGARELDQATASNVTAFAGGLASGGGGTIIVLEPSGAQNSSSVMHVRDDIMAAIQAGGVSKSHILIQNYDASQHGAAAPVRLSYHAVKASVGECGNWIENLADNPNNTQYHDFGCSTQNNLAAIIANPNDLMGPRAASPIDAERRANVIERYQTNETQPSSEVEY